MSHEAKAKLVAAYLAEDTKLGYVRPSKMPPFYSGCDYVAPKEEAKLWAKVMLLSLAGFVALCVWLVLQ